jgi:hypothetical protein
MSRLIADGDLGLRGGMVDARTGSVLGIVPRPVNVAVLAEKEPNLLIQRYYVGERVYQVVRKQTSPHEHFSVPGGVEITLSASLEIDRELRWWRRLTAVNTDAKHDPLAAVFVDEFSQPLNADAYTVEGHPYALIAHDLDAGVYCCEPALKPHHGSLADIRSPNLDAAIRRTVVELDALLQKHWWDLEPWHSASWSERLGILLSADGWPTLFLVGTILLVIYQILYGSPLAIDPHPDFVGM